MHWPGRILALLALLCAASCGTRVAEDQASRGYWWPEQPQTDSDRSKESEQKLARIRELLDGEKLGGLLIGGKDNFAWITAGGDSRGEAMLFVRATGRPILVGSAEQVRQLQSGDLKGLGFEERIIPWYLEPEGHSSAAPVLGELGGGRGYGADLPSAGGHPVGAQVNALRSPLTESEIVKYRWLGRVCAESVRDTAKRIEPGMTERGIESLVSAALMRHAIRPAFVGVAADGRISASRETTAANDKKLDKLVRIRVQAERWGLTVALTRIIHFGAIPDDVQRKYDAAAAVCAGFWARTLPGATASAVLQGAIADYAEAGFDGEWKSGSQGGAIGYGGWDWLAKPGAREICQAGQAFAWHPGIQGMVLEDTILLREETLEVLSEMSGWPTMEVKSLGRVYRLPGILIR